MYCLYSCGQAFFFIKRKTLRPGGKRARALALGTPPAGTRTHTQDALQFALCTHTVVGSVRDSLYTLRAHTDHQLASPLFALSPHSLHTQERVAKIAHHKRASPTHVAHTQLSSHRRSGVLSLRALRCSLQKPLSIRTRGYQGRAYLRCTRSCTPRLTNAGVPALTHPSKCPFPTQRRPPTKRGTPHQTHTHRRTDLFCILILHERRPPCRSESYHLYIRLSIAGS